MDEEDFLAAVEADNANLPVEEPKEPETEPQAAEPEPVAEPEPAHPLVPPVVEAKPDPGFVPLTAMLDERDRRQKLEAELAQYRASQQQQQPQELPDQYDENFVPALTAQFEQKLYEQAAQMSHRFAVNQYGEEATKTAVQWAWEKCATDPYFNQQVRSSGDPVGYAVEQYQRDQIASQVSPSDFEQFKAWQAAQAALIAPAPAAEPAPPNTSRAIPPRSLASAPSAGGVMSEVVQTDEEVFDEIMPKR